jgi:hypothetical protein
MAKKKRRYVRIVKTRGNNWVFKTELGVVVALFLVSFSFLSINLTGNAIANTIGGTISYIGGVLFVLGIVSAIALVANKRR